MTNLDIATGPSGRPSPQGYMDMDRGEPPSALRDVQFEQLPTDDLSTSRYLSREFHDLESKAVWPHTWQMACHESEIPNVGDTLIYQILNKTIIVVRTDRKTIKAFHNSCLHRGTQLCAESGNLAELTCPFHGWTWSLDGDLIRQPAAWDFGHLEKADLSLPQVRVDTWESWVFVAWDDSLPGLHEYLGVLPDHWKQIQPSRDYMAIHVSKTVRCNWKTAMEAFIEGYHVEQTHPQTIVGTAAEDTEYSLFGPHISRMIGSIGVPGYAQYEITDQDVVDNLYTAGRVDVGTPPQLAPGESARPIAAKLVRQLREQEFGLDLDGVPESVLLDAIEYYVFPNFMTWPGYQIPLAYRFRPDGDRHDQCILDFYIMEPLKEGAEVPPAPPAIHVGPDEDLADYPQLKRYAIVWQQDFDNLERVHKGMQSSHTGKISLAAYQESRIRKYHQTIDDYASRHCADVDRGTSV